MEFGFFGSPKVASDSEARPQMKSKDGVNFCKARAKKSLKTLSIGEPYRKPTQVLGHNCAKVYGRNLV